MTKFVEISSLVTEGLQTRDGLAKAVVKDYAETLKAGMRLPPVTVVQDSVSGQLYLVDGYHRKAATVMAGRTMIDAEITEERSPMPSGWRSGRTPPTGFAARTPTSAMRSNWRGNIGGSFSPESPRMSFWQRPVAFRSAPSGGSAIC